MTEHGDGGFAYRQAMLRAEIGNGAIRHTPLSQFRDDIRRREQILELLWTARREFLDRLADCGGSIEGIGWKDVDVNRETARLKMDTTVRRLGQFIASRDSR